jgi:G:T-mismatch repair DNA endonuclease (very short patch repair protein)
MKNRSFWKRKFATNVARDAKTTERLQSLGWKVLIAWECEILKRAPEFAADIRNQLLLCLPPSPNPIRPFIPVTCVQTFHD